MGAAKGSTLTNTYHAPEVGLSVAIDGGNSKTEVVVLEGGPNGLIERSRGIGPGSGAGPHAVVAAVTAALRDLGIAPADVTRVSAAVAGLDFPGDEVGHRAALAELFRRAAVEVVGDAVAVLDAGAGLGHALAVVCGAGLNAVARGPRGLATVPALGWPSGDWGGGDELGREAVRAAARAEDGRGPSTSLLPLVLAETRAADTVALARAIRDGSVSMRQVGSLASVVARAAAEGDTVASDLIVRAAAEAVALASVVARRAWAADPASAEDADAPDAVVPPGTSVVPPRTAAVLAGTPVVPPRTAAVFAVAPVVPPGTPVVPPGTPAVLAGGTFSDPGFRDAVSAGLRRLGFDPRPLEFRPVDGLVRALREAPTPASPDAHNHPHPNHERTPR
ncbi:BadF-type ATPase [Leifsonia sp. 98AMF]|uniref:BadF/BadG/BcrA/BcrD ATPase family protein n=1 Tax=unclassified Leifsonia TaxID=2663824 RepID=UPI00087DC509|nr:MULTISPECIES: BadF/BadG/BcrA/BcrD ATPase family protein [unclassified Leifsonia]SDH75441.1 BadF-type ATPase [Leifsonia sp. 197AMF]SDJ46178.1 BadF-type ATPase [Leifsonia sp. 466MF]SDK29228.1 BadF-type ATPase [Leifsonia sp. 157MF]SDN66462.1 BadF-type ATPase [Leifsonia sp. 509MF]SEN42068.1 BadF-type ATPase [Leifsonia sp. 467MF]